MGHSVQLSQNKSRAGVCYSAAMAKTVSEVLALDALGPEREWGEGDWLAIPKLGRQSRASLSGLPACLA